jgi:ceramide glucosyltransferase
MIQRSATIFEIIAVAGTAASLGYYAACLWGAAVFLRRKKAGALARPTRTASAFTPPISILKPLKGTDPEMYEGFRSHCLQDYPVYEIIFGASDADDPALALVEKLQAEFPQRAIRTVICPKILGANVKVSNLAQMLPEARYEYLIVNDSDIHVAPDYLQRVMAPLERDEVGLVTCLYRGIGSATLGSKLEALGISTDFSAGVLAAQTVENGIRFGLGSTLAFRRHDLHAIGGFEALADYLADDYQLGHRIAAQAEKKVEIAAAIVETHLPEYSLAGFLRHQMRWARTVRDSRRWGYVGMIVTFGLLWALLAVLLSHSGWAWALLGVTAGFRMAVALAVGKFALQDPAIPAQLWLLPIRDMLAFGVWLASFFGNKVHWRGEEFMLKNGKLFLIRPESEMRKTTSVAP